MIELTEELSQEEPLQEGDSQDSYKAQFPSLGHFDEILYDLHIKCCKSGESASNSACIERKFDLTQELMKHCLDKAKVKAVIEEYACDTSDDVGKVYQTVDIEPLLRELGLEDKE